MIKKIPLPVLIIAMVLQIIAPVSMMIYSAGLDKRTLEKGTEYKFSVTLSYISAEEDGTKKLHFSAEPVFYYSPDHLFNSDFFNSCSNSYLKVAPDFDYKDFSRLEWAPLGKERPNEFVYTNRPDKFPYQGTYEVNADYEGSFYGKNAPKKAYAVVKLYRGNAITTELYADGVPIEDWLRDNFVIINDKFIPKDDLTGVELPTQDANGLVDLDEYDIA